MRYIFCAIVLFLVSITQFEPITLNEYNKQEIEVKVIGCVLEEKQLVLKSKTTIDEALTYVNLKKDANLESINTQLLLMDKDVINIPCKHEKPLISINTASVELLMELPGIGSSTAEKIIKYRSEHGLFQTIEQLMEVDGIKESKFNKIKDLICL